MILGIDTSAEQCAVALLGGERHWEHAEPMARGHAEALFPMIEAVLADANASFSDLTKIGVCVGPGSFTGIRVGVAAARGLALSLGIPAVGISRFAALAAAPDAPEVITLDLRGGWQAAQRFGPDGSAVDTPVLTRSADGTASAPPASRVSPLDVAHLAALAPADAPLPAPLYLRQADAAPARDLPPRILD